MDKRLFQSLSEISYEGDVAIYGAGSYGKFVLEEIARFSDSLVPKCFVDDKRKGEYLNLPIINLEELMSSQDKLVIIASSYWKSIADKLDNKGVQFLIADLLNEEMKNKRSVSELFDPDLIWHTPNRFLHELVNNIHLVEPETNSWLAKNRGGCFYDIGASCGIYSIFSAKNGNDVVSIEANSLNIAVLKRNLYLNQRLIDEKVIPINVALSDKTEISKFQYLEFGDGFHNAGLGEMGRKGNDQVYSDRVLCYDLDSLISTFKLPLPTHVKIDVDGAESKVLSGMNKTLLSKSLHEVLVETSAVEFGNISKVLIEHGFKLKAKHRIFEITGSPIEGISNYLFVK